MALRFPAVLSASVLSALCFWGGEKPSMAQVGGFTPLNRYIVEGAVAEIMAATPDGKTLAYTNSDDKNIGILDIANPANPKLLAAVDVSDLGEPTAVAVTPNGKYALATVLDEITDQETLADQQSGTLIFIDLATQTIAAAVTLAGIGPDNLAITPDGTKAIIAIEDEEDEDNLPGDRPGSINFVTIDYANLGASKVRNVALDLTGVAGVNYATDPQPEYVAIAPDGKTVAISLQENNGIAVLDVATEEVIRIFSAGTSVHPRADLTKDGETALTDAFEGRREPDAIAFTKDGRHLITANEGDTSLKTFGDGIYSGGRGWSILDLQGNVVYDSGSSVEELAVLRGQYPEGRSGKRGIEIEGATVAQFGSQEVAIVGSERGSFLVAYDISNPRSPRFLNFLPTGLEPEGILAIPSRNLLLASNEEDGTIDFFHAKALVEPQVVSRSLDIPFGALSALYAPGEPGTLLSVPDNAFAPSRIFTLKLQGAEAIVTSALPLTKDGKPAAYDLEGITVDADNNYWLVSEGDNREGKERPNLLIKVNSSGVVQSEISLPDAWAADITRFGFEGVTTSADGSKVYIAVQRAMKSDSKNLVRILEYTVANQSWASYFYPLDTDNAKGWVGLSEIVRDVDGSFLVIERDNQGGAKGAANVRVKRIYRFSLDGVQPNTTVSKFLVMDLLKSYDWREEKVEGLAVTNDGYWIASDNDGGETYTRLLFISR